ncbi:uncharacterized protein LOC141659974 [Apium graveolens]|uniref:uncharacterized protein LOC141659974 n=1 Tax=Apium graveolens TaxID=4045 RepID=UPI003D7AEDD4
MLLTLSAKNKIGFVDGSIQAPSPTTVEFKHWERCNSLVISLLLFNLDDSISKSVLFMNTTKEVWDDLEERFGYASMTQIYSLEQQLLDIKQGHDSISEFFTKMKTVWDSLNDVSPLPHCTCKKCTCNLTQRIHTKQQEQKLLQFMMKLNDEFTAVRANILMIQPLPNISQVYRLISQEERHKEISKISSQTEAMSFYADRKKFGNQGQRNFYQNQTFSQSHNSVSVGHSKQSYVPNRTAKPASKYFCTNCQIPGHSIEKCFKIHGYPPGFQAKDDKKVAAFSHQTTDAHPNDQQTVDMQNQDSHAVIQAQYNHLLSLLQQKNIDSQNEVNGAGSSGMSSSRHALLTGKMCFLSSFHNEWIVDSGSTDHICPNIEQFQSYEVLKATDSFITVPDGRKVKVLHIGTVKLSNDIILQKVLHVPDFHFRLISIAKLCEDLKCQVVFTENQYFIQGLSQNRPQILLGRLNNGLYSLSGSMETASSISSSSRLCNASYLSTAETAKLWHLRMGHLPFQ